MARLQNRPVRRQPAHRQFAFAKMIRLLARLHKTRPVGLLQFEPVLDHRQPGGRQTFQPRRRLAQRHDFPVHQQPLITLPSHQRQRFFQRKLFAQIQGESDQRIRLRRPRAQGLPDFPWRLLGDRPAATTAVQPRQLRPENLRVIGDLRHRPDRRARGLDTVALLDGDGGRNPFDAAGLRLVHPVQELARVRRERLDITPLPLREKRFKRQRTFPRPA